ncbi:MAG: tripartite tricarboxylate transporter substrate binding protein [Rubrivivax sp.]|nr:tripartite tricarboxylate transporter substrate binding protein [Rubrivivax sp.]
MPPVLRSRRRVLQAFGAAAALGPLAGVAQAQGSFANRPVRIVLPSGAGGGSDIFARPFGEWLAREIGQPVVIENKPGALGVLAHDAVVRQPPDGHVLLVSFAAAVLGNKVMNSKLSHDPLVDLKPIGLIGGEGGNLLIATPDFPAKNLADVLALAKAQNGALAYGSWGIGSGGHLVMEAIAAKAGVRLNHVPYKTVSGIPNDMLAGVLKLSTIDSGTPVALLKAGKLKALAALAVKRLPQLPDVPTQGEQGFPLEAPPWYGLFGPSGMSDDLARRLNALLNRWLALPETIAMFAEKMNTPAPLPKSPEEFAAQLQRELPVWRRMVADAKVPVT